MRTKLLVGLVIVTALLSINPALAGKGKTSAGKSPVLTFTGFNVNSEATYNLYIPPHVNGLLGSTILDVECFNTFGDRVTVPWPLTWWQRGLITQLLYVGNNALTSPYAGDHCRAWTYRNTTDPGDTVYPPVKSTSSNVVFFSTFV